MIIVLPKTSAFGIVQFGTIKGKLNGTIEATTPIGKCSVRHSTPRETSRISPETSCGIEQANSVSTIDFSTSAFASSRVLPFSSETRFVSSSKFFSSKYLYLKKTCTRSLIGVLLHTSNAFFADSTAAFSSSTVDIGTLDSKFPSSGDTTSNDSSELLS